MSYYIVTGICYFAAIALVYAATFVLVTASDLSPDVAKAVGAGLVLASILCYVLVRHYARNILKRFGLR